MHDLGTMADFVVVMAVIGALFMITIVGLAAILLDAYWLHCERMASIQKGNSNGGQ